MKWIILLFFAFSSILFFAAILNGIFYSNRRLQKRMKYYLTNQGDLPFDKKKFNFLMQIKIYNERIQSKIPIGKGTDKIDLLLNRAGVPLTPAEFVLFRWLSTAFVAGMAYLIFGSILASILGLLIGYTFPVLSTKRRYQKRLQKFNDGLPDMITIIIGSLRAGFSFPQSLKSVVEESESPIKEEIDLVLREMQYGISLEDALNQLQERMPSGDLELMIQAILIQRQVGGNLATVLEIIVQTIRDRNFVQRQITTLTAQGRLSGIVIGSLPILLGIAIYLMNPEYMQILFTHPIGLFMVVSGTISSLVGFILIKKLTTIEV
jgi:tight adherence protein B